MKKLVLILLAIFLLSNAVLRAREIGIIEAELAARQWIALENAFPQLRLAQMSFRLSRVAILRYNTQAIGFLVRLDPQGFMIIPGITELAPVKFITFDGEFASLRRHALLQSIFKQLLQTKIRLGYISDDLKISGLETAKPVNFARQSANEGLWTALLSEAAPALARLAEGAVPPLLTSRWSQGAPYNLHTPAIGGERAPTGCSATSQAQIMYYWKYPDYGRGSHSYPWQGQTLSANFNHKYYWGRMLDRYLSPGTAAERDAVARLMSDIGISINMDYGTDGSAAVPNDNNSLVTFFKYSPEIRYVSTEDYPNWTAWFNVFKEQVDRGWPASLAISNPDVGHSVVVDGYRSSGGDQVHINMGWGGSSDAYYAIDNILDFTDPYQYAVINIHPEGPRPPSITRHPQPQTIVPFGQTATLSVEVSGTPPFSYQWYRGESGSTSQPITGAVGRSYSFKAAADSLQFWVRVLNDYGYAESRTAAVYLSVYPPANFRLERIENDFIFFKEYINRLSWQLNPENRTTITRYKLYRKEGSALSPYYLFIKDLDPTVFSYEERGLKSGDLYSYKITAVNVHGIESEGITVSNGGIVKR
jgi:hypothetical protein